MFNFSLAYALATVSCWWVNIFLRLLLALNKKVPPMKRKKAATHTTKDIINTYIFLLIINLF